MFMSMYGSITDAQIFSRELSEEEMIDVTSCRSEKKTFLFSFKFFLLLFRSFLNGDILSWDEEPWELRTPWNRSEIEMLDLENDICTHNSKGLLMVPQKLNFEESIHICEKVAGSVITFVNKTDFEKYVNFLSLSKNMKSTACIQNLENENKAVIWAGGSDNIKEGEWKTWDRQDKMEVK